ncbi:glycosyltransferase family 2 protein [Bacteroidota bacterium]
MDRLPQVNIVILNWNGLEDTLECLESLRNINYPNYKIIVVDNHSTGNDVELIKEKYENEISKLIVTEQNLGFSGGNNIGIDYSVESGAEYILLLNNDTVVEADFLTILVNEGKSDDIGIVSPMIAYFSDNKKIWSAGGKINKLKASGFTFGRNKNVENFNYARICSFASGCCLLIKSRMIKEIGKLDENYFLYPVLLV